MLSKFVLCTDVLRLQKDQVYGVFLFPTFRTCAIIHVFAFLSAQHVSLFSHIISVTEQFSVQTSELWSRCTKKCFYTCAPRSAKFLTSIARRVS